ncbi:GNAT family N-acetyltransferase [Propionibacterium sp.]|uniref:GNAT family N-acetyltransferase n=1 Tax=Propionibacterium sp. TaxID=1977903 RepID=UPI0039E88486
MSEVIVTKNPAKLRYEAHIDGALAGFAEYSLAEPGIIDFHHTEVDPEFGGQGVGGEIARFALDDVRAGGGREVVPSCPFIKGWIGKHREYQDLLHQGDAPQADR